MSAAIRLEGVGKMWLRLMVQDDDIQVWIQFSVNMNFSVQIYIPPLQFLPATRRSHTKPAMPKVLANFSSRLGRSHVLLLCCDILFDIYLYFLYLVSCQRYILHRVLSYSYFFQCTRLWSAQQHHLHEFFKWLFSSPKCLVRSLTPLISPTLL